MKLGVDLYSIRLQKWTPFQYVDYCHRIGVDLVHFSGEEYFESFDEKYLKEIKAHADGLGLSLEMGIGSICPTASNFKTLDGATAAQHTARMLRVAKTLGSPVLRCFLGSWKERVGDVPLDGHVQAAIETCKAVRPVAMELGVKRAIENHAGDLQGWELRDLIERAGPEFAGACIDSGNPLWVAEDPAVTLEHLAPYALTSHVRDSAVWPHPKGACALWVAMGDGNIGIDAWTRRYRELCPDKPFTLEIITGGAPKLLNYRDDEFWRAYPKARAAEFARFERLAYRGLPYDGGTMAIRGLPGAPPEYQAAVKAQQLYDLERSVRYCREKQGIGER